MILLNWKLKLPPNRFELILSLNQQAKKQVTVLTEVIDSDYKGKIELLLQNGGKKKYVEVRNSMYSLQEIP